MMHIFCSSVIAYIFNQNLSYNSALHVLLSLCHIFCVLMLFLFPGIFTVSIFISVRPMYVLYSCNTVIQLSFAGFLSKYIK